MGQDTAELLKRALELPEEARAELAELLWATLEHDSDPGVEAAWTEEIRRRTDEIDRGEAKMIPWEEVLADLRARLRERR